MALQNEIKQQIFAKNGNNSQAAASNGFNYHFKKSFKIVNVFKTPCLLYWLEKPRRTVGWSKYENERARKIYQKR